MDVTVYVNVDTRAEISVDDFADLVKACVRHEIASAAANSEPKEGDEEEAAVATPVPPAVVPRHEAKLPKEAIKMKPLESWGFAKTRTSNS